jgi:hypothetical protein
MANRRDDYMNRRSWLIDTAETPADQKRLKSELAKLDKKFNPNRVASTSKSKPASKSADGSNTKPYNVRLIKPSEIIKDKPAVKKAAAKITKKSATTLSRKPKAGPVVKMTKKAGKK